MDGMGANDIWVVPFALGLRGFVHLTGKLGEFLTGLEDHHGLGGDAHLLVRPGIASDPRSPAFHLENAEVPQFHAPVLQQGFHNGVKDILHGLLGDDLIDPITRGNLFGDIFLGQGKSPTSAQPTTLACCG
jgi:hypothetical protein